jgi:hypothetical protein
MNCIILCLNCGHIFEIWVSEDKITTGDIIIAIEHLINN